MEKYAKMSELATIGVLVNQILDIVSHDANQSGLKVEVLVKEDANELNQVEGMTNTVQSELALQRKYINCTRNICAKIRISIIIQWKFICRFSEDGFTGMI